MAVPEKSGLRFTTRNYKHELRLDPGHPRSIVKYTDEVWETLCREIAARDFTGIVFYVGYHPFEFILDYSGFPEAATRPARDRDRIRRVLNRGLAAAHRHGLQTFMQHYITHFTKPLAVHLGIPTTGRLSNIDHPELIRYQRWCYREMFRQCPDLDGLYFNFESANNAYDQLLRTSVVEFNRMRKKPIAVYRLWGLNQPDGVRALVDAYSGRTIVGHKISDTNDTYYLPVADSRATEWKRLVPGLEFMFLVGPCHNCGTNLCQELWGDYDYVQEMLRDAEAKGADSISFHTLHEFFSLPQDPEGPSGRGADVATGDIFTGEEPTLARYNVMHLDAAVDYFHGKHRSRRARIARMAERNNVSPKAGEHLYDAVTASSQLILLTYQQFCSGSAYDGYLNPGRFSHIQDPFYYYPATELNHQATRPMWQLVRSDSSWLKKRVDTTVAPDGMLQYVIDYVDPSKKNATQHPRKVAALLAAHIDASLDALRRYRRAAGTEEGDRLAPFIRRNAAVGEFVRHEILAAIQLYGIYFAKSRGAILSRLREGLAEFKGMAKTLHLSDDDLAHVKRALLFDRFETERPIALLRQTIRAVERTDFPIGAYRDYLASRREYNEIRRTMRALRSHNHTTVTVAVEQLKRAIASAEASLAALGAKKHRKLAANVNVWLAFLRKELARTTPPVTGCTREFGGWLPLDWDHGFRAGEDFIEDFLGFFTGMPVEPESHLSFRIRRDAGALVVQFRETGIDPARRREQWERYRASGSNSFVERIFVDPFGCAQGRPEHGRKGDVEGKGKSREMFIVWPAGESVSVGKRPNVEVKTAFEYDAASTTTTVWLPWKLLGARPKKGDVWRFNINGNPAILRNRCFTWSPQYDSNGNPSLFGKVRFE